MFLVFVLSFSRYIIQLKKRVCLFYLKFMVGPLIRGLSTPDTKNETKFQTLNVCFVLCIMKNVESVPYFTSIKTDSE